MIGRRRLGLVHRFTLAFSLVILLVVGLLAAVAESYVTSALRRQTELRARSLSLNLAAVSRPYLLNYDYLTLQQMADATLAEPDLTHVIILDKEGKVAGYGGRREMQGAQLTGLQDMHALHADGPVLQESEYRDERGREIPIVESVIPVRIGADPGGRWGTVRVGLSLSSVHREALGTRILLLIAAAVGILGGVYASHKLARRIARPLGRLVLATTALERGEWNPSFSVSTGDEIEELASRFAQAAQSLDLQKKELVAAQEELIALNATLEDKVQRRTAELAASREKYRLLVEGSPDAFVLLERDRVTFANRAFLEIFEYPADSPVLENLRWTRFVHPDFHRVARDHLRRSEETLEEFRVDLAGQTRSGKLVELEVRGRGVQQRGGRAVELVLTDVGEKRRLLRQVMQSERLRAMGEMTAMVAHNFNNLLAVILGRTQLLLRKDLDDTARENLRTIQNSSIRAGEMVRQLQEYFGDQMDLRFGEVDLNSVLREVTLYLEDLWRTTREPGAPTTSIRLDLGPVPQVLGAEPLLQDVFRRVLVNAAEAMEAGGEIRVCTESRDRMVLVRVEDDGCGMTPEVQRRAFDPFFTTKGSRMRGLGLSTSFGIVQQHEGRMELRSEPGTGTVVDIMLPARNRMRRIVPFPTPPGRPKGRHDPAEGGRAAAQDGRGQAEEASLPGESESGLRPA